MFSIIKLIDEQNKATTEQTINAIKKVIDRPLMDINNISNLIYEYIGHPCNVYTYKPKADRLPRGNKRWFNVHIAARSKEEALVIYVLFDFLKDRFFDDFEVYEHQAILGNSDDFLDFFNPEMIDYKSWLLSETDNDALEFQDILSNYLTFIDPFDALENNSRCIYDQIIQVENKILHISQPCIIACEIKSSMSTVFGRRDIRKKDYYRIIHDPHTNQTYYDFINYEMLEFQKEDYQPVYSGIVLLLN